MRHGRCGNPSALLTILGVVVLIAAGAGPVLASEILAPGTAGADTVPGPVLAAASDAIGADPVAGDAPLSVRFTDTAPARWMSEPMYWEWSFGDGGISLDRNPVHVYRSAGTYTVNMTITYWGRASPTDTSSHYYRVTYIAADLVTVLSSSPPAPVSTLAGTTRTVCDDAEIQERPRIDGGTVVWQDNRNSDRASRADIYAYDIANGTSRRLTTQPSAQDPAVSGSFVAWTEYSTYDAWGDLMMIWGHDLSTGAGDYVVAYDATWNPAVDGESLAFAGKMLNNDGYSAARRIYLVEDRDTHIDDQITPLADFAGAPDLTADWVVYYTSVNGGDTNIHAYDRRIGSTRVVCDAPGDQVGPRIWGDRVVWTDYRNAVYLPNGGQDRRTSDIYSYNLTTGTERRLTTGTSLCLNPAISGDLVVWTDLRNQNYDIYSYDLRTGQERAVTAEASAETEPDIDHGRVVYRDGASNGDIRLRVLTGYDGPAPVLPVSPNTSPPSDTNNDGKYDDVNGNGRPDFADVVLYFNQMTWIADHEPVGLFDYNGNGRIDFADVVWLFNNL